MDRAGFGVAKPGAELLTELQKAQKAERGQDAHVCVGSWPLSPLLDGR